MLDINNRKLKFKEIISHAIALVFMKQLRIFVIKDVQNIYPEKDKVIAKRNKRRHKSMEFSPMFMD